MTIWLGIVYAYKGLLMVREERTKSYLELPGHANLLWFPVSSDCCSHFMRSLMAFEYSCSSGVDHVTHGERRSSKAEDEVVELI